MKHFFSKQKFFTILSLNFVKKGNIVDSILCKESKKPLFYDNCKHMIQSTTKNKI